MKCDGTRAENRFRLSAKRIGPFKLPGAPVQSTTGRRVVRNSGSIAGYTIFRGSVKSTGYLLHSPVTLPFLPLRVAVLHHISTRLYQLSGCGGPQNASLAQKLLITTSQTNTRTAVLQNLSSYCPQYIELTRSPTVHTDSQTFSHHCLLAHKFSIRFKLIWGPQ
jgi:hypothetical protein